ALPRRKAGKRGLGKMDPILDRLGFFVLVHRLMDEIIHDHGDAFDIGVLNAAAFGRFLVPIRPLDGKGTEAPVLRPCGRQEHHCGEQKRGPFHFFAAFRTKSSTTEGSARVEMSPRLDMSPSAILRRMRRMILPERVLGKPGANWITSGLAIGPISWPTNCFN